MFVLGCHGPVGEGASTGTNMKPDAAVGSSASSGVVREGDDSTSSATSSATGAAASGAEECPSDPCADKACGEACSVCYFCDNGTCATDWATHICDAQGECVLDLGAVRECARDFDPCAGKQCGEVCDLCPTGADCLSSEGLCDAKGACLLAQQPVCSQSAATEDAGTNEGDSDGGGSEARGSDGGGSEEGDSDASASAVAETQYFEPGCGEAPPTAEQFTPFAAGYYVSCEVSGLPCPGGGVCRLVTVNPCPCSPGAICCDACGRGQRLCLATQLDDASVSSDASF